MIYRVDSFTENNINPITNCEYDSTWLVFALSSDMDTPMIVGTNNGCAYTIKSANSFTMIGKWLSEILLDTVMQIELMVL